MNIVLVHGAWADGSSWSRVIPLLLDQGHHVTAAQIPLTSLAEDTSVVRRILALQRGPTVLVGHSYGGMVISEAAASASNVTALVYVSGFAAEQGETLGELNARNPTSSGALPLRFSDPGFVWIDPAAYPEVFAHDVDPTQARIMAAVQKPIAAKIFGEKATQASWKSLPSWYLVSERDRILAPETQWFMAKRMNSAIAALAGSHASLVSHAAEAAELVAAAARRMADAPAKAAIPQR